MQNSGAGGEQAAAEYYMANGFVILERNYHSRYGEIDIIAADDIYIVFVEVKTRKRDAWIKAEHSIDFRKQQRITNTALQYLSQTQTELQPRFDVVIVENDAGLFTVTKCLENTF